ncbi:hypothetical protein TREES_T100000733 [Tupaia chinensis]|uniref:Uncharacterized protein n=1 Tax=Tupaia chinensis TaxID=246437 RepID=L9KIL9_TUPCH|nr:hypothetical protein TREES_T100000733 [Tupaia chinensis]
MEWPAAAHVGLGAFLGPAVCSSYTASPSFVSLSFILQPRVFSQGTGLLYTMPLSLDTTPCSDDHPVRTAMSGLSSCTGRSSLGGWQLRYCCMSKSPGSERVGPVPGPAIRHGALCSGPASRIVSVALPKLV